MNMTYLDNPNNGITQSDLQHVWAHESGHGMGLGHNTSGFSSVMTDDFSVIGPTSSDTGQLPGCAGRGFGINCIYGYGN